MPKISGKRDISSPPFSNDPPVMIQRGVINIVLRCSKREETIKEGGNKGLLSIEPSMVDSLDN